MIRLRQTPSKRSKWLMAGICSASILAIVWPHKPGVPILYNDSASVPLGFWLKTSAKVQLGAVIGFRPPPAAMPYVALHMPQYVSAKLILKYVVAVAGDQICRDAGGTFSVDGRPLGRAVPADNHGNRLPVWQGCQTITGNDVAVFSDHIPNSFDSRFYGVIPAQDIYGVYQPLWTWTGGAYGEQH
jgi:type IV secretory pathway protease TraF